MNKQELLNSLLDDLHSKTDEELINELKENDINYEILSPENNIFIDIGDETFQMFKKLPSSTFNIMSDYSNNVNEFLEANMNYVYNGRDLKKNDAEAA